MPFRSRAHRAGTVIVIVLGLIMVLAAFGAILKGLSASANREVDIVSDQTRAIGIGESVFSEVVARLTVTPWSARWFRTGADIQLDQSVPGGYYSYVLQNSPPPPPDPAAPPGEPPPQQADLLVRASFDRSTIVMFWRLTVPRETIDSVNRIIPSFFSHLPTSTPADPSELGAIGVQVGNWLRQREDNKPRLGQLRPSLMTAPGANGVAGLLGGTPTAVDEVAATPGAPARPNPPYIAATRVKLTLPALPAPPPYSAGLPKPGPTWPGWMDATMPEDTSPMPGPLYRDGLVEAKRLEASIQAAIMKINPKGDDKYRYGPKGQAAMEQLRTALTLLQENFGWDDSRKAFNDPVGDTPMNAAQQRAIRVARAVLRDLPDKMSGDNDDDDDDDGRPGGVGGGVQ